MGRVYGTGNQLNEGYSKMVDNNDFELKNTAESEEDLIAKRGRQRKADYWDILKNCTYEEQELAIFEMSDAGFRDFIERKRSSQKSGKIVKTILTVIGVAVGLYVLYFIVVMVWASSVVNGSLGGHSTLNDLGSNQYQEYPYTPPESDGWNIDGYLDGVNDSLY